MEKKRRYTLRISESLHQNLTEQAQKDSRSLHGQIIHILMDNLKNKKAVDQSPNVPTAFITNHSERERS